MFSFWKEVYHTFKKQPRPERDEFGIIVRDHKGQDTGIRSKTPLPEPEKTGNRVKDAEAFVKWMRERPEEGPGIQELYDDGYEKICPGTYRKGGHVVLATGYEKPLSMDARDSAESGRKLVEDAKRDVINSIRSKAEADEFISKLQKKFEE